MKTKRLHSSGIIACATATLLGAGLLGINNNVYADDGYEEIYVLQPVDGTNVNWHPDYSEQCFIYATYSYDENACDSSYGSFDTATKTLTLGSGVNGGLVVVATSNGIDGAAKEDLIYTIKATSNIEASFESTNDVIFDLGRYSYTVPDDIYGDHDFAVHRTGNSSTGSITFESGIFNLFHLYTGNLTINGGEINMNKDGKNSEGIISVKGFTINGGSLNILDNDLVSMGFIHINGGDINIRDRFYGGGAIEVWPIDTMVGEAEFIMTGGSVVLDTDNATNKSGVSLIGPNSVFTISGGTLRIKNLNTTAISLFRDGKINFYGGTLMIENSSKDAVKIASSSDPEHAITFANGMGIKEKDNFRLYYYTEDEGGLGGDTEPTSDYEERASGAVGIVSKGERTDKLTITHIEDEESDAANIGVPDTGVFSDLGDKTIAVLISLGALAMISGVTYLGVYAARRLSARAKFNK